MKRNIRFLLFEFVCLLIIKIYVNAIRLDNINVSYISNMTIIGKDNFTKISEINKLVENSIINLTNKLDNKKQITSSDLSSVIKQAYSDDGENEAIYSANNPITGLDYWKSKKIKNGDYADWNIELINNT